MKSPIQRIDSAEEFKFFRALLRTSKLPADDVDYTKNFLIGYYEHSELVATGGLEVYGHYGLLRSVAVKQELRGKSLGTIITSALIEEAKKRKLKALYLLTETAHQYFLAKGFNDVKRDDVPEVLKVSSEFSHVCPVSAAVMVLEL